MRCFDHFFQNAKYTQSFKNLYNNRVIVDCTTVAQFYFEENIQDEWDVMDFKNLSPPYSGMWLDFDAPSKIVAENTLTEWGTVLPIQWGLDCAWREATEENILRTTMKMESYISDEIPLMIRWSEGAKWMLDVCLFWRRHLAVNDWKQSLEGPLWFWRIFLDDLGQPMPYGEGARILDAELEKGIVYRFSQEHGISMSAAYKTVSNDLSVFLHTGLLSIYFMHCKGPIVKPIHKKPLSNKQKRRGDAQQKSHKILIIEPYKERYLKEKQEEKLEKLKKEIIQHTVKGTVKTYTKERPLFGKYAKTIYVPEHKRGTKKTETTIERKIVVKKEEKV